MLPFPNTSNDLKMPAQSFATPWIFVSNLIPTDPKFFVKNPLLALGPPVLVTFSITESFGFLKKRP